MSSSIPRSPAARRYLAPLLAAAAMSVASLAPAASAATPTPPPKKDCKLKSGAHVPHGKIIANGDGKFAQCNDGTMVRVVAV
jgi:hypothetical protein